jgi:hypothetical protein
MNYAKSITEVDSVDCGKKIAPNAKNTKYDDDDYKFAESYAAWGWTQTLGDCHDQELFRMAIDTPKQDGKEFKYDTSDISQ